MQPLALPIQLAEQIFRARHIGFRLPQLQFRFMAAGAKPGNAGGFFQNAAPVIGLGLDQRCNTALADQRRRPRAGTDIGEHGLHIACAQFLAIDTKIATLATRNPARHFQFGDVVIG